MKTPSALDMAPLLRSWPRALQRAPTQRLVTVTGQCAGSRLGLRIAVEATLGAEVDAVVPVAAGRRGIGRAYLHAAHRGDGRRRLWTAPARQHDEDAEHDQEDDVEHQGRPE